MKTTDDMIIDNFLVEVISASSPLEGDLNGDGFVGIADLNIVLSALEPERLGRRSRCRAILACDGSSVSPT
ncbi:MAG: hypothetical protein R3C45_11955 [Phycisphaerales bacterium]